MRERFLSGADAEFFDYARCDEAEKYDDTAQQDRDAQDRWFDEDD